MDAAALIKEARTRAQMTQAELAAAAGTSQPTIAAYESGTKSPSVKTFSRLIAASGSAVEIELRTVIPSRGVLLADLQANAREIKLLAKKHHVSNVRVFGSAARGEDTAESDIDLLVDFDGAKYGLLPLVSFSLRVAELMKREVDASPVTMLKEEVRESALRDAVAL